MIAVAEQVALRCPLCGAESVEQRYELGGFSVLRCGECDLGWRSNMHSREQLEAAYRSSEYADHPYFGRSRRPAFDRALDELEARTDSRRLLDAGCGVGEFLAAARQRGWEADGIDLSPLLAGRARQAAPGADVAVGAFEDAELPAGAFDAVTLWDVIEHVLDPAAVVARARDVLRPGGVLLVCTPDEDSQLARLGWTLYRAGYRYAAEALHPRYHNYFFSRRSLDDLLRRHGLVPVAGYSQPARAGHSPLAGRIHRAAIAGSERVARIGDRGYERVTIARREG